MRLMTTIIQRSDEQNKSKTRVLKHFEKTQFVKVRLLRPGIVSTNVLVYANIFALDSVCLDKRPRLIKNDPADTFAKIFDQSASLLLISRGSLIKKRVAFIYYSLMNIFVVVLTST